ncbi:ROK family protein [Clostridium sp. MCC353]|uniref:ROK family transcriptional regulator n=1 Tax=Clostridium sp. MCC353 TaxID=2592646 RepID=UPI001C00B7AC|nr:ROK family transcriptional regulator [Clostridium sp. MCC353]MBT9776365.1 ROK family protein [Clostridium sp. MCC353]
MAATGMTTMEVKKINRHNIYTYIYEQKTTSKQNIVDALHLSLSTVTHNLKLLEEEGLICRAGYYESTGGRKAQTIEIVRQARIALGMGILKDTVHMAAMDLYGNVISKTRRELPFSADDDYYQNLGRLAADFIRQGNFNKNQLLGTGIAIQGIITSDGGAVSYGKILNHTGLKLSDLARYIPCKTRLFHDSKAAAQAELWGRKSLKNALVLLLNQNMGGALILDRQIYDGLDMHGGLIEHICIDPNGPECYCGQKGCLETFCSADSLKKAAGVSLDIFFEHLRQGDDTCKAFWSRYLDTLAFAIRNQMVVLDSQVIVSGLLAGYMNQEDFDRLEDMIIKRSPFPAPENFLLPGQHGALAPAIGSGLFFVEEWLKLV